MLEYPSISKRQPEFPKYLDFQTLRDIGIQHLQALSGKIWTDYNLHDPGVTILEVLCYAITDLGYRNNLDIQDLLALNPDDGVSGENNFFTPNEILTCNPVTELDLRKRLIDIPGVRNAWLEPVTTYKPAIYVDYANSSLQFTIPNHQTPEKTLRFHPRGLYTVYIDLDLGYRQNSSGRFAHSWSATLEEVKAVLCSYRNLCEDFDEIIVLDDEEIAIYSDIELEADADPEDVLVEIYVRIQAFLSPRLQFYTLQELLDKGKSPAEIFAGRPLAVHEGKIECQLVKRQPKVYYQLVSEQNLPLLVGEVGYDNETAARSAFAHLLVLSQNQSNYHLIDDAEGDKPYSFALYDKTTLLASHPNHYATTRERNQVLHSLMEAVIIDKRYESHGFIDTAELEALNPPEVLYTSDLYQEILKVPGVAAVRKLSIINYINNLPQSQHPWYLHLSKGYSPELTVEYSQVKLFKGVLPIPTNFDEVKRRYYEQEAAYIKAIRKHSELDLSVPKGNYYDLADHYSIQHDFPLTYGISEDGLPETASALRKAQARQLKGYLVFFDQLLANYLAQLAHVRDLFSWEIDGAKREQNNKESRPQYLQYTYFQQSLKYKFPGWKHILNNQLTFWMKWYREILKDQSVTAEQLALKLDLWFISLAYHLIFIGYLDSINEDTDTYRDRRNRFLDHLLGRFAESFSDYVLLNYQITKEHDDKDEHEAEIIHDKAHFLKDYPTLSRDRFRAFNYYKYQQVWNTDNVSGFQKRVSRLLGIENVQQRNLYHYKVDQESNRYIFSVSYTAQQHSLKSVQTYASQQEAKAELEKCLRFALEQKFYQRLAYDYFYHYGWELEAVDEDNKIIIARCDRYFLSHTSRSVWLSSLLKMKNAAITTELHQDNLYYFQLKITANSSATEQVIEFKGVEGYHSPEAAEKAGNSMKQKVSNQQNYRPICFRQDNTVEWETSTPSNEARFTYYGYALIDDLGQVLAESSNRLPTKEERDTVLQNWLSNIQANQNQFISTVELINDGNTYIGRVYDHNNEILLQANQHHSNAEAAWQQGSVVMELAAETVEFIKDEMLDAKNFRLIDTEAEDSKNNSDSNQSLPKPYGWELTNRGKDQVLATHYYTSTDKRNQSIIRLQKLINDEGFHVLEHILLRPQKNLPVFISEEFVTPKENFLPIYVTADDVINQGEEQPRFTGQDPYSFWISVILPYWPERFSNVDFRKFVERTLRLEAPAHVALKIAWLDVGQMWEFENAYHKWLEALAVDAYYGNASNLTQARNQLLAIIPKLRSVYPKGKLSAAWENSSTNDLPIVLNQTALGGAHE